MAPPKTQPGPFDDVPAVAPEISEASSASLQSEEVSLTEPSNAPDQGEPEQFTIDMVPPEYMEEFFKEMESAIQGGIIPPALWARGFESKVTPELAKLIATSIPVEKIVEKASENPTSAIVTRDGQNYLRKVWAELAAA